MGKDLKGKELGRNVRQRKDGRYVARYIDRFGKRKELINKDLTKLRDLLTTAIYEDKHFIDRVDESMPLDKWFGIWMKNYKNKTVRETTALHYTGIYERHISPVLGKKNLVDIKQIEILEITNDLDDRGYEFETRNKVKVLLADMFDKAMENDYASKNPARKIKIERDEEKEPRVLAHQDQKTFFECAKGTFMIIFIPLLFRQVFVLANYAH